MTSLVDFPVSLPTEPIAPETNALAVATAFLPKFSSLGAGHFDQDAVWRDLYTFTGTLRTFYSASTIEAVWKETSKIVKPGSFSVDPNFCHVINTGHGAWVQAILHFETTGCPATIASAIVELVPDGNGGWKIWTLRTIIEQLKGQANVDRLEPVNLVSGAIDGFFNDVAQLINGKKEQTRFDCVVIGGGQAGLSMGGRLQALGVKYVVLDQHKAVGDSWKTRYTSARLHTTREYAHLPFDRTFPDTYPDWLTKDDLAQGYRDWAAKYGINIRQSSKVIKGRWDKSRRIWMLTVLQSGEEHSIEATHVVLAGGGGSQVPLMPEYPNRDVFSGRVLHSGSYVDANEWKGKHGVVIGTANTAHDVAEDMLAAGCVQTTMIQRSKTWVVPLEYYKDYADTLYNPNIDTGLADKLSLTTAMAIQDLVGKAGMHARAREDFERFDALDRAGFKTERYGSLVDTLYNRMGGHYMDIGASAKIAKGLASCIKVKSDSLPVRYLADGLEFEDGSKLKADVVVFATGFRANMKYMAEDIFGCEVAEQMGEFWTLDKEGEIKGAFKPCGHPAVWYFGGTQGNARYYSRFVALQIKADLLGTPLAIYSKTP